MLISRKNSHSDPRHLPAQYEVIFTFFAIGFLLIYREYPSFAFPQLLYVMLGLLFFNLLFKRFLLQKEKNNSLIYSSIFINGLLITFAMKYSGGSESPLWVMYLLPIFSACLLSGGRQAWVATGYAFFLMLSVYYQKVWTLDLFGLMELLGRTSVLILSALVTSHLAKSEQNARQEILSHQEAFQKNLEKMIVSPQIKGDESLGESLIRRSLHDVNVVLTVILGSAYIIKSREEEEWEGESDVKNIQDSAYLIKSILDTFIMLSSEKKIVKEKILLQNLIEGVLNNCRYEVKRNNIHVTNVYKGEENFVYGHPHYLPQALTSLFNYAIKTTPPHNDVCLLVESNGSRDVVFSLSGPVDPESKVPEEKLFDPFRVAKDRGKGLFVGLFLSREMLRRHGGDATLVYSEENLRQLKVRIPISSLDGQEKKNSKKPHSFFLKKKY